MKKSKYIKIKFWGKTWKEKEDWCSEPACGA